MHSLCHGQIKASTRLGGAARSVMSIAKEDVKCVVTKAADVTITIRQCLQSKAEHLWCVHVEGSCWWLPFTTHRSADEIPPGFIA